MTKKTNITLIGMAGVGKTTLGKRIAKYFKLKFIDIDDEIENSEERSINEIIAQDSEDYFIQVEEKVTLNLDLTLPSVLSTGGSIIYTQKAMEFLKEKSTVVFLQSSPSQIKHRLHNLNTRGIIGLKDKSFEELYYERLPLYKKYADLTFRTSLHPKSKECLEDIVAMLKPILQ
jgi:shikimate kinase